MTLYAHNSQLLTNVGDSVSSGQIVTRSGHSGVGTGARLHFTVIEGATPGNLHGGHEVVLSARQGQCQQEFFNPAGEVSSLTQTLGQDVAQQLALGRYQREIQALGQAKLQEKINQAAASKGIFYPEDIWAPRHQMFRQLLYGAIAPTLIGLVVWQIVPSLSEERGWRRVVEAAPPTLRHRLEQDYTPHIPAANRHRGGEWRSQFRLTF